MIGFTEVSLLLPGETQADALRRLKIINPEICMMMKDRSGNKLIFHPFWKCQFRENGENPLIHEYNTRSLSFLEYYFSQSGCSLVNELETNLVSEVLELGCGRGRVLLELIKKFPQISFTGLTKAEEADGIQVFSDILKTNSFFDLNIGIEQINKSLKIIFEDVESGELPNLKNESYRLVYSFAFARYIKDKLILLSEIYRILKPGGFALVELTNIAMKDKNGENISLDIFFNKIFEDDRITFDENSRLVKIVKKDESELAFPVKLVEEETLNEVFDNKLANFQTTGFNTTYILEY